MVPSPFLTADQVLALAPDATSIKAARELATARRWSETGADDDVLWGLCQGSGSTPYQVRIERNEPAFACSCPSRKFPCKHALGLLLLAATEANAIGAAERPAWVNEWLDARAARVAKSRERRESGTGVVDVESRDRRRSKRLARTNEGLELLDQWLRDFVRQGSAALAQQRSDWSEAMQRRLIDAQAPGLARHVAAIDAVVHAAEKNPRDLLAALGRLYLLGVAGRARDRLAAEQGAAVDQALGIPVAKEQVLAGPLHDDAWLVAGRRTLAQGRIFTTVTWLFGLRSAKWAQLIETSPAQVGPSDVAPLGVTLIGKLAFFGGAGVLRALFDAPPKIEVATDLDLASSAAPASWERLLDAHAARIAAAPWVEETPFLVRARPRLDAFGPELVDDDTTALPWQVDDAGYEAFLAIGGGYPVLAMGTFDGQMLRLLAVDDGGQLRSLPEPRSTVQRRAGLDPAWARHLLLGTTRSPQLPEAPHAVLREAFASLGEASDISEATLRACALLATAEAAGCVSKAASTGIDACGPPTPPTAGAAHAANLQALLASGFDFLLAEWLEVLEERGLALPHASLPTLLDLATKKPELRRALNRVSGVRGRWLARHSERWAWARGLDPRDERAWTEGTMSERQGQLAALFEVDAEAAARRLIEAWSEAGGDERELLLDVFEARPPSTLADFLETKVLGERRQSLRLAARRALLRMGARDYARRAAERAEAVLRVHGTLKKRLVIELPQRFEPSWARDGILDKPPRGVGERAFWARQLLASVPLSHWCERFGVNAKTLITWNRDEHWQDLIHAAFCDALLAMPDGEAALPFFADRGPTQPEVEVVLDTIAREQLRCLAPARAGAFLDGLLTTERGRMTCLRVVDAGILLPVTPSATRLADVLVASTGRTSDLRLRARAVQASEIPRLIERLGSNRELSSAHEDFLRVLDARRSYRDIPTE